MVIGVVMIGHLGSACRGPARTNGLDHMYSSLVVARPKRVDRQDLLAGPHDQQIAAGADIVEHGMLLKSGVQVVSLALRIGFGELGPESLDPQAVEADDRLRLLIERDGHVGKEGGRPVRRCSTSIGPLMVAVGQRSAAPFLRRDQP